MTKLAAVVLGSLTAVMMSGCSSNPKVGEVLDKVGTAYCQKWQTCDAAGFGALYPTGVGDCAAKFKSAAGKDVNAESACSDSDVNTCIADINAVQCATFVPGAAPASCNKC